MRSAFYAVPILCIACGTAAPEQQEPVAVPTAATQTTTQAWTLAGSLVGEWKNDLDTSELLSYEHWWAKDSAALDGLGFVLSGMDTVSIEDLRITRRGEAIVYSARISTQNNGEWVEFQLQPTGPDTLLFTNPGHDFPSELRYVRGAPNVWDVLVKGGARSFALRYVHRPSE